MATSPSAVEVVSSSWISAWARTQILAHCTCSWQQLLSCRPPTRQHLGKGFDFFGDRFLGSVIDSCSGCDHSMSLFFGRFISCLSHCPVGNSGTTVSLLLVVQLHAVFFGGSAVRPWLCVGFRKPAEQTAQFTGVQLHLYVFKGQHAFHSSARDRPGSAGQATRLGACCGHHDSCGCPWHETWENVSGRATAQLLSLSDSGLAPASPLAKLRVGKLVRLSDPSGVTCPPNV